MNPQRHLNFYTNSNENSGTLPEWTLAKKISENVAQILILFQKGVFMKNVTKNFFYQSLFQILKIIMPIITIPIVSSALGPKGIGIYNYTNSIVQYFVLIAGLGISIYASREIAMKFAKDRQISGLFWEIFLAKGLIALAVIIIYFLFIIIHGDFNYLLAQSLVLISVLFDISWLFMGVEDFKKTSMSALLVQIIIFILTVFLIKSSDDTLLYTWLQCLGILLPQLLVWIFIKKYIHFEKIKLKNCLRHLRGAFQFFIPQVAIMIYTNLNKTLLGIFIGTAAVGYYSNSVQLNTVFITLITTLDLVLLPKMSGLFAQKKSNKIVELMETTVHIQLFFSIPIMFGMITVVEKLVPWFFGTKFLLLTQIIPYLSILIVIIPLGMTISRQYLMPIGKINEYNKSVIIGAIISIICNLIFLPTIGFFGVIITNIVSEFFVTFVRTRSFLKTTEFKFDVRKIVVYFFSGVVMLIVTRSITHDMRPSLITNLVQVIIAATVYFILVTVCNENIILNIVKSRKKE